MQDWTIEPITKNRIPYVASLAAGYYGEENDIACPDYLEYQYFNNPDGDALMHIAWDESRGKVASQCCTIPIQVKIGQETEKSLLSVNTLTDAAYRGQGIFSKLGKGVYSIAAEKGYSLIFGMPNQNSYPIFMKHLGFRSLGTIPLYLRPLKPSNMVSSYLKSKILSTLARPFDCLFAPKAVSGQFVDLTSENIKIADDFWELVKDKYPIMIARNSSYLNYRFVSIPRREYICRYVIADGKPVAFAIGRVMNVANIQCGMLADFLYLDGYEAQAKLLLNNLMAELKAKGADMAGCLMQSHFKEAKLLKRAGFFVCPKFMEPQPFILIVRSFVEKKSIDVYNPKNWFFTMGDYDVV